MQKIVLRPVRPGPAVTVGKCRVSPVSDDERALPKLTGHRSEDHMARDCDRPRDVSTMTCRNCDEVGHFSTDCPKPRDYSRVKCNNCGESKCLLIPAFCQKKEKDLS